MKVSHFISLLQDPSQSLSNQDTLDLEMMLQEYPYFQAGHAIYLKGLKNQESYKYNSALRKTAVHTVNREVLFDFITSEEFQEADKASTEEIIKPSITSAGNIESEEKPAHVDKKVDSIAEMPPESKETNEELKTEVERSQAESVDEGHLTPEVDFSGFIEEGDEKPLPQNLEQAEQIFDPELFQGKWDEKHKEGSAEAQLKIGKPLEFTKKEHHSFSEWLQLTSLQPHPEKKDIEDVVESIPQKEGSQVAENPSSNEKGEDPAHKSVKQSKFDRLDRFISANPRIVPSKEASFSTEIKDPTVFDHNALMTETLARVYLEQKKYKKAMQAYKILSLKYPEKSGYFADQISAIKKLRKEKS